MEHRKDVSSVSSKVEIIILTASTIGIFHVTNVNVDIRLAI